MSQPYAKPQRSPECEQICLEMISALLCSHKTDEELIDACRAIINWIGQGAEFDESQPVFSASLLPMHSLNVNILQFLKDSPPVIQIEGTDPDTSSDAIAYLIDVCNSLGFTDSDIVEMGRLLEMIGRTAPVFRFQLVQPNEIRVHLHCSGEKDVTLASWLGFVISEQERIARLPPEELDLTNPLADPASAYQVIVDAYRRCISSGDASVAVDPEVTESD
jgi:hypothetical protein